MALQFTALDFAILIYDTPHELVREEAISKGRKERAAPGRGLDLVRPGRPGEISQRDRLAVIDVFEQLAASRGAVA